MKSGDHEQTTLFFQHCTGTELKEYTQDLKSLTFQLLLKLFPFPFPCWCFKAKSTCDSCCATIEILILVLPFCRSTLHQCLADRNLLWMWIVWRRCAAAALNSALMEKRGWEARGHFGGYCSITAMNTSTTLPSPTPSSQSYLCTSRIGQNLCADTTKSNWFNWT